MDDKDWVNFEVMAETDGYVSLGLSDDKKMVSKQKIKK